MTQGGTGFNLRTQGGNRPEPSGDEPLDLSEPGDLGESGPFEEKAVILASLAYIIALAFYKRWLHSQYDVMNGSLIERAFATAGKPWYWFFLLAGFAFIILLVCMGVHLFRKDKSVLGNLVGLILNIVLIVILVTVFWDPIFTTFVVLAFVAGTSAAAMS